MMSKHVSRQGTFLRIAVAIFAVGTGVAGEGCGCGDGPYVDNNDELQCGDCNQYAWRCVDPVAAYCAPDDYTLEQMGCNWWTEQKDCTGNGGGTAGDTGGGTAGGGEVGTSEPDTSGDGSDDAAGIGCADWDPDAYVNYNRLTRKFEIERALVDDLTANPLPLTECDQTRAQILSGGYYELVRTAPDDLATHLGLLEHDQIRSINGLDVRFPDDYARAYETLKSSTSFAVAVVRSSRPITLRYEIIR